MSHFVLIISVFPNFIPLANSANTNCRRFRVKVNCSKFIIDGLQHRCHMTLLVSFFVSSRNLLLGVFLTRKIITILRKITINSRQVLLKSVIPSVRFLEYFGKTFKSTCDKAKPSKIFTAHELLHKWLLRFPIRSFSPIYRSLFVSYKANKFCYLY